MSARQPKVSRITLRVEECMAKDLMKAEIKSKDIENMVIRVRLRPRFLIPRGIGGLACHA
jgi:hypothetical protein